MLKKGIKLAFLVGVAFILLPSTTNAYILNSNKLYPPKDLFYWIDPSFSTTQTTEIATGIKAWNVTPEIEFVKKVGLAGGAEVKIEKSNTSKGDIVGTSYGGGHIILWKGWNSLSSTDRKETVVHEVGHELGLAHTQAANKPISVMRDKGFNGKPNPLSDDKKGISAKY